MVKPLDSSTPGCLFQRYKPTWQLDLFHSDFVSGNRSNGLAHLRLAGFQSVSKPQQISNQSASFAPNWGGMRPTERQPKPWSLLSLDGWRLAWMLPWSHSYQNAAACPDGKRHKSSTKTSLGGRDRMHSSSQTHAANSARQTKRD